MRMKPFHDLALECKAQIRKFSALGEQERNIGPTVRWMVQLAQCTHHDFLMAVQPLDIKDFIELGE